VEVWEQKASDAGVVDKMMSADRGIGMIGVQFGRMIHQGAFAGSIRNPRAFEDEQEIRLRYAASFRSSRPGENNWGFQRSSRIPRLLSLGFGPDTSCLKTG